MLTKTVVGIATLLYSFAAHAQAAPAAYPPSQNRPDPAQILERVRASSPLTRCAAMASTEDGATVYKMIDGISYEFAHGDGKITSVTAIAPGGQRMKVDAAPESKAPAVSDKSEESVRRRAAINQAMEKFLKTECARLALREAGEAAAEPERAEQSGTPQGLDADGYWGYSDYLGYSDYFTTQMVDYGMSEWRDFIDFSTGGGQMMPKCTALVKDCSDFCTGIGQLEYSGCGGLALAAGFTLGPPTGAAVGFYCSANVYVATEQCRRGCQTPTVTCNWN